MKDHDSPRTIECGATPCRARDRSSRFVDANESSVTSEPPLFRPETEHSISSLSARSTRMPLASVCKWYGNWSLERGFSKGLDYLRSPAGIPRTS